MPVTASNGFPCLQKNWRSTSKSGFLGCQSSQFQGNFGKRWFKLCTWFWVCNILDLPFWIPCCILCVELSTHFWMSLQCFWFAKIAYDFVSGEKCIFLSDSLTVSYLLPLGLRFWRAPVCWKRFSWTEVFFMSHHAGCSVPKPQTLNLILLPRPANPNFEVQYFWRAEIHAQRENINDFSRPLWFDCVVFSLFLVFFLVFFFVCFFLPPAY